MTKKSINILGLEIEDYVDFKQSIAQIFDSERYCPNCKQNVYPTREWGSEILFDIFLLIVCVFVFSLLAGIVIWLVVIFLSLISPFSGNKSCPMCKTPQNKLLPARHDQK